MQDPEDLLALRNGSAHHFIFGKGNIKMLSIFVTIDVKEEFVDQFAAASLEDARGSVEDEPLCYRFDISQDEAVSTRFYLYEVYADEKAFQYHLTTPHFLTWKNQVEPWFVSEPEILRMSSVFPSSDGWKSQKPGLTNF